MNLPELRDWVRRRLGAPIIRVELTDDHITDAYDLAVDKYLYYNRPKEDYYYFTTNGGKYVYGPADFSDWEQTVENVSDLPQNNELGDIGYSRQERKYYEWVDEPMVSDKHYWKLLDPDPTGTGIPDFIADTSSDLPQNNEDGDIRFVDVEARPYEWSETTSSWTEFVQTSTIPVDVLASVREVVYQPVEDIVSQLAQASADFFLAYFFKRSGGMYIADLWIAMAAKESFNYVLGLQPTWEILNNKLYLWPKPQYAIKVGIKYALMPTEEELCSHEWVTKATLAQSKVTLGAVRGKYSSIPGPAGEGITLNGDAMKEEGKTEWEQLILDIINRSEPMGFSIG